MLFVFDSQGARLRQEEMLREAANARLARRNREANGAESLLKRMVNLLTQVTRRSNITTAPAQTSHQQALIHGKVS